jgi:hypothetical protein
MKKVDIDHIRIGVRSPPKTTVNARLGQLSNIVFFMSYTNLAIEDHIIEASMKKVTMF